MGEEKEQVEKEETLEKEEQEGQEDQKDQEKEEDLPEEKNVEEEEGEDPLADLMEEDTPSESPSSEEKETEKKEEAEEDPLASLLEEDKEEQENEEDFDLTEEEGEDEEGDEEEDSSSKRALVFTILSLLAVFILLASGVGALWYLWQHPPLPATQVSQPQPQVPQAKEEPPLVASPIGVENRQILFLKNFLLPYQRETGEYVFVKAKVLLYFENKRDLTLAQKNIPLFREHIYRILKNVPLYVWENKKGAKVINQELLTYLKKREIGGVAPQDLEVTGYILK